MKNKIVVWGTNAAEEKILVALELLVEQNKVMVYTFPEKSVTDEFYTAMMEQWRDGKGEVNFPEEHTKIERQLSITESLLPEDIKVERTDLIQRAQTEWHFVVLSSKLSEAYRSEMRELEERIASLREYNAEVWENLKGFWSKVQAQLRDRTLLREHGEELRSRVDHAFTELKEMRSKMDQVFKQKSAENLERFSQTLADIENRISENKQLKSIFEELKGVQKQLRDFEFTREHRNQLWAKVDKLFKDVKEKRFGDRGSSGNKPSERTQSRLKGLQAAIEKMERSIKRDEEDLEFQRKRIKDTDGQLEAQIREAKIQMIQQRVNSKHEKLADMKQTLKSLEERLAKELEREAKQAEKQAAKAKAEPAPNAEAASSAETTTTAAAPEVAPAEDKTTPETATEKTMETVEAAEPAAAVRAAEPTEGQTEEPGMLSAIGTTLGESFEDIVDTVKAVAVVLGDQLEDKIEAIKEDLQEEE
ncbi:MAG: hypothetical protein D6772_13965 [Bacteroidetes bacterium]|nr:MAG: hypothetical protein D6772_13965 [Bacteroidota bacterium]